MSELILKYSLLDAVGKQLLLDYLNTLLKEKKKTVPQQKFEYNAYRKKILLLGKWDEKDISLIKEAHINTNTWQIKEW